MPRLLLPALLTLLLTCPATAQPREPLRTPPSRPIDVLRIDLDLTVRLEKRSIEGHADITIKALRDVTSVSFDAVDFEIKGVPSGKEALPYHYDGKRITVDLKLERGKEFTVRIEYRVKDPKAGLHFFGPTKDAPETPWQVWSQGEMTYNRYWFPCVDHPDERQATSVTARVAKGLTVISNGKLISKTELKGDLTAWKFEQARPHVAYLVSLVVGTFDAVKMEPWRKTVPMTAYVPPGRAADAPRSFKRTGEMMELFTKLTGIGYPWAKYDQVVVEQFSWGGMENTSATTLNERTLHDARAHLDYRSEGLVAHELAHQWYGDLLTCRDWAHVWLNESFATFMETMWTEHAEGKAEYAYEALGNAESGMKAGKRRPILDRRYPSPDSMFDGRAYPKGSSVLHQLRRQLGDEAFWRGVKAYTKQHQGQSVETHDLRRALERASGQNLERFFYDWLERAGHPDLKVTLGRDAKRGLVTVTIEQRQRGEAYHFPAELELGFGDKRVVHTLDVRKKSERFVLAEARAPTWFRFDPREAVILKDLETTKPRALWIEQLRKAGVIGRVRAARALAKDGSGAARAALLISLAGDTFWGVRAEIAEALGPSADATVQEALRQRALKEENPYARREVVKALGARGQDPLAAQMLAAVLRKGDKSYYVEAEAIRAYARAAAEPKQLLLAQLKKPSHNETIREAALQALHGLDDPSVLALMIDWTAPGKPGRLRGTAARGLALAAQEEVGAKARALALEALTALLRQENGRLRRAALQGLAGLGKHALAARPQVAAIAKADPQPRLREQAERTLKAIDAAKPPRQQLGDLQKQVRALKKQTSKLERAKTALEARVLRLEKLLRSKAKK